MNIKAIRKQFWRWLVGLILVGALAACAAPAQTPVVELTVSAILASAQPTTVTPFTTPTVRSTLAPTHTPKPKPSQEPLKTTEYRAPNGWWSAQGWGEFRGETYHAELRVTRADGKVSWIASQDWNAGLGVPLPTPLAWSQDGRYLYYTNVPLVDGYACSIPVNGSDLWQMDLTDGSVTQLVPEVGLSVSLSPDEQTFAYVSYGPQQNLVLRDLATGEERRMSLPADTQAGGIVWSLDSSVMMLTVVEKPCSGGQEEHTIVRVDVTTLEQRDILPDDDHNWVTYHWADQGVVVLMGKNQAVALLDPTTNKFLERNWPESTFVSPDKKWIMFTSGYILFVELSVIDGSGTVKWDVTIDFSNTEHYEGYLRVLRWSPDGHYLYFTLMPTVDGCGAWNYAGTNVQRLDIETGRIVEMMHGNLRVMSISPDTKWLAYLDGKELVLYDMTTGSEQREALEAYEWEEYVTIGNLVWSPDSKSILMIVETNSCSKGRYSIVQFERSTQTQTTLMRDDARNFRIYDWTDTETVWLSDHGWSASYLQFNPITGELTAPTIVPQNLSPN